MSYTLGIYFSLRHCHAVFMQHANNQYHYQGHFNIAINLQSEETKRQALIRCQQTFSHHKRTILGLRQHDVLIQKTSIDAQLTDTEIMKYLTQQANTNYVDYALLSQTQSTKTLRVVTAQKSLITAYQNLFSSVGIPLHAIDVDILALERLSRHTKHLIKNLPEQREGLPFFVSVGLAAWGHDL